MSCNCEELREALQLAIDTYVNNCFCGDELEGVLCINCRIRKPLFEKTNNQFIATDRCCSPSGATLLLAGGHGTAIDDLKDFRVELMFNTRKLK